MHHPLLRILLLAALAGGGWTCLPLFAAEPAAGARQFVAKHCLECHATDVKEGRVDLEVAKDLTLERRGVSPTWERAQIALWTRIYDQVAEGRMPPKSEPRPDAAAQRAFLNGLATNLKAADRKLREVVQRRLNREMYQNSLRDLLAVDIELKSLLPEDQQAGGFDNNGEALSISAELMAQYLLAAETALDAAIVRGPRPETVTFTVDPGSEVKKDIPQYFGLVEGRTILYTTDKGNYSKLATRPRRTPIAGRYRFRFEAATHHSDEPVTFNARVSDFHGLAATNIDLGFYEADAKPKKFEIEAVVGPRSAIQFFALDLPGWIKDGSSGEFRGVGFSPVEITGPLFDQWPPKSHQLLLGDLDLAKGRVEDAEPLLRRFISAAFRRPATDEEVVRYMKLVQGRQDAGRSLEASLRAGYAAILCSPNFLYLREAAREEGQRVSDHELASRLAYFLWNSPPDAELLRCAEQGTLQDPKILAAQIQRMLRDPRKERFVTDFTGQWLRLRQIDATTPDPKVYPEFDDYLKWSMVAESQSFFRTVLDEDLPVRNFLDSDFALLNRRLARHYALPTVAGTELQKVKLPEGSVRGGVLTQGAVLKVTANGTSTSPVPRGVWVLENILGRAVPPPPPNISALEPDTRGAATIREQLAKHRDNESCNSCHRYIDPPGFALESFDPAGKFREQYLRYHVEPQNAAQGWGKVVPAGKVDASGELATGEKFNDIRAFKKLLVQDQDRFARCLTEKLMTYALGRELGFSDRESVDRVWKQAAGQGGGLRTLLHAIAESSAFSTP